MNHKASRTAVASLILLVGLAAGGAWWAYARRAPAIPVIAMVPRAGGAMLWEVERFGATTAAEQLKCHIYWNAPTSEGDAAGQIALIDKVVQGKFRGLVVAPNHSQAILSPLRRAVAAGLPVVVVSAPLDLPAGKQLGYIVNDDDQMGDLAAAEVARLIQGRGSVALVGITRTAPGVMRRVRSAERLFATRYPAIRVVRRMGGAHDTSRAEELTDGVLETHPDLAAVLSFTATATRGVHAAARGHAPRARIQIVGCEQDTDLIAYVSTGEIAAVLAENTYRMGYEAVEFISASWTGKPIPERSVVPPLLITRANFRSPEAVLFTRFAR